MLLVSESMLLGRASVMHDHRPKNVRVLHGRLSSIVGYTAIAIGQCQPCGSRVAIPFHSSVVQSETASQGGQVGAYL